MAAGLLSVVCLLCVALVPVVSARNKQCKAYTDLANVYHTAQRCSSGCCGTCNNRVCCSPYSYYEKLDEDDQDDCQSRSFVDSHFGDNETVTIASGVVGVIGFVLLVICCCVCPCCCLYKMCRRPRPVMATTTHTTVVNTSTPRQYPQQPTASPGQPQSYQGAPYPSYQPVPVQSGYGAQPMPQGYGGQPMPQAYGGQPMPMGPYQGQPYTPGLPPPYHEAVGPGYPPAPMPYSQAAFTPGQPAYPPQPPAQPQPQPSAPDYLAQPAYNPDYPSPPPKPGY